MKQIFSKKRNIVIAIVIAFLVIVCSCALLAIALFPKAVVSQAPVQTVVLVVTELVNVTSPPTEIPTQALTDTPRPTHTPRPTNTPEPTADPDLINPGTYLVGTDIQPGLYKGMAGEDSSSSCYWKRLSSFSGDDTIIDNDNAIGSYYVEVLESDFALETHCPLRLIHELIPVEEFPTQIEPGVYLVGIDIGPGMYRGEAGTDLDASCYWKRLSSFSGDDTIIDNDNAIGQYYVEVLESDYALETHCNLELVK